MKPARKKVLSLFITMTFLMSALADPVYAANEISTSILSYVATYNPVSDVKTAQKALNTVMNASLDVDGIFGILTDSAVRKYQKSRGLTVDGKVGPLTWAFLMGEYQTHQNLKTDTNYLIFQYGSQNGVLDIPAEGIHENGTQLQLWTYVEGNQNQLFALKKNSDGSYRIYSKASNKALEVRNSSKDSGAQVAQWDYENGYACKDWFIRYDSSTNAYEIINKNSLLALDLSNGTQQAGNKYQQWMRNNTAAQRFTFQTAASIKDTAAAAFVPPVNIHISQGYRNCTAASAAMLLRANCALHGKNYNHITLNTVLNKAWSSGGLSLDFKYDSVRVTAESLKGTAAEKEAKVKKLLSQHPEGIVLYGWNSNNTQMHAVYMASDGKILDPMLSAKYYNLSQSANPASQNWSTIKQYWIIA